MTRISLLLAAAALVGTAGPDTVVAFVPASPLNNHHGDTRPSSTIRSSLEQKPSLQHQQPLQGTMEAYDLMVKRAYQTQATVKKPLVSTAQHELKQTTTALNAALDELKEIRELMKTPPPVPQQQVQQVQQAQGQQVQTLQQEEGRLQLETNVGGALTRPTTITNTAASPGAQTSNPPPTDTAISTDLSLPAQDRRNYYTTGPGSTVAPWSPQNEQGQKVNSSYRNVYTPGGAMERRVAKTETNRQQASEAFDRGSAGYYGRYGIYGNRFGYGPYARRYGTAYENSFASYGGAYDPFYYRPYGYGYGGYGGYGYGTYASPYYHRDPFLCDYGFGNYYGDGRRNSYLWGSERMGPDFYTDQVHFAERQRDMDKERGRREYAERRRHHEQKLLGPGEVQQEQQQGRQQQPGQQQQQQQPGQQQQLQQQQQQNLLQPQSDEALLSELSSNVNAVKSLRPPTTSSTSTSRAGPTSSYLDSMKQEAQHQQQQPSTPSQPLQQQQASQASQASTPATPEKPKFSYLESAAASSEQPEPNGSTNDGQAPSTQDNNVPNTQDPNAPQQQQHQQQQDAPYAEAEQMPFDPRQRYDRYGTSYGDFRYNNSYYSPYGGYYDPYFGASQWGRYGGYGPYVGGYGGVRGGDWFSDQIRRSERERVYDAQARSRWGGFYGGSGYYGGYGRNTFGDYTFSPRDYV